MNLNQHYTFLMNHSNGAVILDDLGSFLLEKLQRSVQEKHTVYIDQNFKT